MQSGGVRVGGERTLKPARQVAAGDVLTFPQGARVRVVRIEAPGERRGPPPEAQALYTDLSPPAAPRAGSRRAVPRSFCPDTAGPSEARAWTIEKGTRAPEAAGTIHSDFEKGFIRAEVMNYQDLLDAGSEAAVKQAGKLHLEGKDYVVQDGDVMLFKFNV